jgi:hypothetical protein
MGFFVKLTPASPGGLHARYCANFVERHIWRDSAEIRLPEPEDKDSAARITTIDAD